MSLILLELFFFFFRLAAKLIGPKTLCQFFKNCLFFPVYPLNTCTTKGSYYRTSIFDISMKFNCSDRYLPKNKRGISHLLRWELVKVETTDRY